MDTQAKAEINGWNTGHRSGPLNGLGLADAVIGIPGV
jgi:hypothetical protein